MKAKRQYRAGLTSVTMLDGSGVGSPGYASSEFFYESQYGKWGITRFFIGCLLSWGKHVEPIRPISTITTPKRVLIAA